MKQQIFSLQQITSESDLSSRRSRKLKERRWHLKLSSAAAVPESCTQTNGTRLCVRSSDRGSEKTGGGPKSTGSSCLFIHVAWSLKFLGVCGWIKPLPCLQQTYDTWTHMGVHTRGRTHTHTHSAFHSAAHTNRSLTCLPACPSCPWVWKALGS